MTTRVLTDNDVIDKLLKGAEKVYKAVSVTMGSAGNFVMFDSRDSVYPVATKDGVSVAMEVDLKDNGESMGAMQLIQAARRQLEESGDGTTLTVVLAYFIYKNGLKALNSGINPKQLRDGIGIAVKSIVEELKKQSTPVEEIDQGLKYIATISMNGNELFGKIISEAIEKVGEHGIVTHVKSKDNEHSIEYKDGYDWDMGVQHSEFLNGNGYLALAGVKVVIAETPLAWGQELAEISEIVGKDKLVIICSHVQGEALQKIVEGRAKGYEYYVVPVNGLGIEQQHLLEDIASLTGASIISNKHGLYWNKLEAGHIGAVKSISSVKNKTIIEGVLTPKARVEMLSGYVNTLEDKYEEEIVKKSIAKLSGGIAVVNVGGNSETEQKELMDRVDDAIKASRSAQKEGIVKGGGVALLNASTSCNYPNINLDVNTGIDIVTKAVEQPIRQILANAGHRSDLIIERIICGEAEGYSVNAGVVSKMEGVFDPTKVIRTALMNAASVAGMMLQSSVLLVNED